MVQYINKIQKQGIKMNKIAFIGAGNMASAIAGGILKSNIAFPDQILLYDKNADQYKKFTEGCRISDGIPNICKEADYIFLCVKPQNVKQVLNQISNYDLNGKIIISICAGITIKSIENIIGKQKIIRAMPNTPLLIGNGVTALCRNEFVNDDEFLFVTSLFSSSGYVEELDEEDINGITAVTSSSPAYVYLFVKSMFEGAKKLNICSDNLEEMICKTLIGSANMILNDKRSLDELISMVKSPKGTTERALNVFENNGFTDIIIEAMIECAKRADELSKLN